VRVTVTELKENTFYAQITIVQDGREVEVDSRPSDAIALAVRCDAQIFATDDVIDESAIDFQADDEDQPGFVTASSLADLDPGEFRKFLETVTVEEFASSLSEHLAAEEGAELEGDELDDEADEDDEGPV